jgi:hypothetical protein
MQEITFHSKAKRIKYEVSINSLKQTKISDLREKRYLQTVGISLNIGRAIIFVMIKYEKNLF